MLRTLSENFIFRVDDYIEFQIQPFIHHYEAENKSACFVFPHLPASIKHFLGSQEIETSPSRPFYTICVILFWPKRREKSTVDFFRVTKMSLFVRV